MQMCLEISLGHVVPHRELHESGCLIYHGSLKKILSLQVILISSSDNPVPDVFAEHLSKKTGCEVRHLKEEKQVELERLLKEKELMWKEVAYIGERAKYLNKWKKKSTK